MSSVLRSVLPRHKLANDVRLEFADVTAGTWARFRAGIVSLEQSSFPGSIRDSEASLRAIAHSPTGVFLVCHAAKKDKDEVVGYACGDRLNRFADVPGAADDPKRRAPTSFYLSSVAVQPSWRSLGI